MVRLLFAFGTFTLLAGVACGRIGYDGQAALASDSDASAIDAGSSPDVDAQNLSNILLAAGWEHTCAAIDGRVACWGNGDQGQLGQGDREPSAIPKTVNLPGPATALAAARFHSCALVAGDVYCWGAGDNGLLGTGNTNDSLTPVQVSTLASGSVTSIGAASFSSCAVSAGDAYCWGLNSNGQLGIDSAQSSSVVPAQVQNVPSPVDVVIAAADRSCTLAAGTAYCWGHDHEGDLGTPGNGGWIAEAVTAANGFSDLSLALSVSCGLISGGVKCWGKGGSGQLGDGLFTNSRSAVEVIGLDQNVTAIHVAGGIDDAGEIDTLCAIQSGSVLCWGRNDYGQVGDLSTTTRGEPVPVIGLAGPARKINGGTAHVCAVTEPNNIECWGKGIDGQLGNSVFENSASPVLVPLW